MVFDPKKQAEGRIFNFSQNSRWRPSVKDPKLTKFDPANYISAHHLDPVHLIWTKFGMDILVDPRNKSVEEFFIFLKIQDGRLRSKVQNQPNLTIQIHFGSAFGSGLSDLYKIWHGHTS